MSRSLEGKYIIINADMNDYFKNEDGSFRLFDTKAEACMAAGLYELDHSMVVKIEYYHIEN